MLRKMAMKARYLEVTFRHGRPFAAYLYLPRQAGEYCVRTESREAGLLIDRTEDGRAIGIEIVDPQSTTLESLNRVLSELAEAPLSAVDVAPLAAT